MAASGAHAAHQLITMAAGPRVATAGKPQPTDAPTAVPGACTCPCPCPCAIPARSVPPQTRTRSPMPPYLACTFQEAALLEDVAVQYSSTYEFVGAGSPTAKAFGELFDALVGRQWAPGGGEAVAGT